MSNSWEAKLNWISVWFVQNCGFSLIAYFCISLIFFSPVYILKSTQISSLSDAYLLKYEPITPSFASPFLVFSISFRQKSFSICDQKVCPYAKFRIYCKHHWTFRSLADQIWEKFEGKNKLNILFHNINSDDPSPLLSTIYSRRTQYMA